MVILVIFVISYFVIGVLILSLLWLYTNATADVPRLYARPGKFRSLLETRCAVLKEKYVPPFWCPFGNLQTALRQLVKVAKTLPYQREILEFSDGGQVGLDWFIPETSSESTPVVLVLPGLTGSSSENYVLDLVDASLSKGYKTVVFNNRGNGDVELLTCQTYNAAYTDDLQSVIYSIHKKLPKVKILAVGISLGGLILFNYISKTTSEYVGLVATMVVSSPFDAYESTKSLETFLNWLIFNRPLASILCKNIAKNQHLFREKMNLDYVLSCRTIREFDERFIVPMFGYENIHEYYRDAGLSHKVNKVVIPTMCLNAVDDIFAPIDSIPLEDIQHSENVAVVVTNHGGHIAFLHGLTGMGDSLIESVFVEYSSAVLDEL